MELVRTVAEVFGFWLVWVGKEKIDIFDGVFLCCRQIRTDFSIVAVGVFDPGNQLFYGMLSDFLVQGLDALVMLPL